MAVNYTEIDIAIIAGLVRYKELHVETGGFLRAVLENDLTEAVGRASENNLRTIDSIVSYVYMEMPSECWGNKAKVRAWLDARHEGATPSDGETDEPPIG